MWNAKLINKSLNNGVLTVVIEYSNGIDTLTETYTSTGSRYNIKNIAIKRIQQLTEMKSTFAGIKTGSIDLTPEPVVEPEPQPVPEPTQEELDRSEYSSKLNSLRALVKASELGIIEPTNTRITTLRTWVKDNFKIEYADLLASI
jgi:hypothetical protein